MSFSILFHREIQNETRHMRPSAILIYCLYLFDVTEKICRKNMFN